MSDAADQADELSNHFLNLALNNLPKSNIPEVTGFCLNCDDLLVNDVHWCDADCRDDWLKRNPNMR